MTRWPDLAAALLRVYASSLSAAGWGVTAGAVMAQARALECRPPAPDHLRALQAAGYVTADGQLTPAGVGVLARALDGGGA